MTFRRADEVPSAVPQGPQPAPAAPKKGEAVGGQKVVKQPSAKALPVPVPQPAPAAQPAAPAKIAKNVQAPAQKAAAVAVQGVFKKVAVQAAAPKIQDSPFVLKDKLMAFHKAEKGLYIQTGAALGGTKILRVKDMDIVVPNDPKKVLEAHTATKQKIAEHIVITESQEHIRAAKNWTNSAQTIPDLQRDAASVKPAFADLVKVLAAKNHGKACFGPNDCFILKSTASMTRKVNDDVKVLKLPVGQVVAKTGDAVRGSIVVKTPQDITNIVESLQTECQQKGWDITFKNAWLEDRANGYVGVHAKVKLVSEEGQTVMAELQIHLPQIYDGEPTCLKESAHFVYEYAREAYGKGGAPVPPSFAVHVSVLQYLSHLQQVEV